MKIHNFISIFLLLLFAVALLQCAKEGASTEENFGVEMRNTSQDCVLDMGPNAQNNSELVDSIFLPYYFTDCPLQVFVVYKQLYKLFAFTDYLVIIPDNPDCDGLKDYLESLTDQQKLIIMENITEFAFEEAKRRILQDFADGLNLPDVQDVLTYRSLCTQLCEFIDFRCIVVGEGFEIEDPSGPEDIGLRGGDDKNCWIWKRVKCGEGCCKTTAKYVRDINGKLRVAEASTVAFGPCEGGPPQNWPEIKWNCREGHIVSDCEITCVPQY